MASMSILFFKCLVSLFLLLGPSVGQSQAPQPFAHHGMAPQPFADQPAAAPQPFADQGQAPAQVESPAVQPAPSNNLPPRTYIAVQGSIYCLPCNYDQGSESLGGSSPLAGATVSLVCNNTKYPVTQSAETDRHGTFFLQAPKSVSSYGAHKCRVFLVSSPYNACNEPTDMSSGHSGAALKYEKGPDYPTNPFTLYYVGPFAFAASDGYCRAPGHGY